MERLASGSSIGLAGWGSPTLPQDGFTLYLRIHSARNLAAVGRGSYCKLYLGNTEVVNGSAQAGATFSTLLVVDKNTQQQHTQLQYQPPTHRVFRTKVVYSDQKSCPQWNEKLELHVVNPTKEILTIRVKNQLMLFCPSIGACAIPLCNVTLGHPAEQWFPLHKGGKPAGHIRLQLLLKQKDPTVMPPPAVSESPMQRLIQQHCQQERDRRELQQSDESMRRQQFAEQERLETEKRRQREKAAELERQRAEELAIMQTYQAERQQEEQEKIQGYLQKQLEHEDDWQVDKLAERMSAVNMQEASKDMTKDPSKDSNFYFADDMMTASTSMRSSNSSLGLKQSFADSQEGNRSEPVVEAVVLTDAVLDEVVHDALPSSDSSSDGYRKQRKEKERRKPHSRKQSRSLKDEKPTRSQVPLFPRSSDDKPREEVASLGESLSSSEESSSSEEERRRRRRRRRKEKKARHKERRRRRKAKRKQRRASDGYESSSSSSSYSSSSSSSSSSSDERRKRTARNHTKSKERAQSQREGKASSIPRAAAPPHSNSYGPDHSNYAKSSANNYFNQAPPTYASPPQPQNEATSRSGYIATMPPQPQQKRSMGEMLSTAADVTSILSDVASIATSVQQLASGGDGGGGAGGMGIPFAMPDMSQFMGGQDLSGLAGQDFSGLADTDTAQYF